MVKSKNNQEWALRFGNAFALATKAVLVAAVGIAYTQHIWRAFKEKALTVEGIDAVVAASNDVFTFLNREIWLQCFTGTVIAGLLWILPIVITLLPPASLAVHSTFRDLTVQSRVPAPTYDDKAYAEIANDLTYKGSRIGRLIWATGTNVATIPMNPSYPTVSYEVDFYGPSLNCALGSFDRPEADDKNVVEVYNFSNTTSNVLSFWTRTNDKYFQCGLYNTSFHTVFSFHDNIQSTNSTKAFLNPVKYPNSTTDKRDIPYSIAYQGWMDPISDMLIGHLFMNDAVDAVGWFSNICMTGLCYSSDVQPALQDQLAHDASIGTAQLFRPLEDVVEEFSVNMTMSLFSSSLLSPSVYSTNITVTSPINIYAYNWKTLLLPYLASVVCSVVALLIGVRAFRINEKGMSTSFSSIMCTTRNRDLDDLFERSTGRELDHWAFRIK
ncbi:hypothetical protein LPUS_05651 [Lasallia pustulata]|uniref:Uncharacterized protein n=1 Tax=Lasallia pustulata TaxID=136370 RepID=A0A1W5CZW7_9LECA|nr:hypothetical protein LPUS_05651 [Lasallia pustulata]